MDICVTVWPSRHRQYCICSGGQKVSLWKAFWAVNQDNNILQPTVAYNFSWAATACKVANASNRNATCFYCFSTLYQAHHRINGWFQCPYILVKRVGGQGLSEISTMQTGVGGRAQLEYEISASTGAHKHTIATIHTHIYTNILAAQIHMHLLSTCTQMYNTRSNMHMRTRNHSNRVINEQYCVLFIHTLTE